MPLVGPHDWAGLQTELWDQTGLFSCPAGHRLGSLVRQGFQLYPIVGCGGYSVQQMGTSCLSSGMVGLRAMRRDWRSHRLCSQPEGGHRLPSAIRQGCRRILLLSGVVGCAAQLDITVGWSLRLPTVPAQALRSCKVRGSDQQLGKTSGLAPCQRGSGVGSTLARVL